MSTKEQIRKEILAYLEIDESMNKNSKAEYLQALLDKHFVMTEADLILDKYDFQSIIRESKSIMSTITVPAKIGNYVVDQYELSAFCLMEAHTQILNSKRAFLRLPRFNKEA